jgi:hypothetical protein
MEVRAEVGKTKQKFDGQTWWRWRGRLEEAVEEGERVADQGL